MPHKFNAARRHKFPKKRYRVTNWAEYTEILRRRGDLTIWVTDDTLKQWRAPRRTTPGGQPKYSNIAIETCLTLRTIYKLPLRQTQGLMRSIARLMGVDIPVPDFSTLSRRGLGLRLPAKPRVDRTEPIHLTMDSTGLTDIPHIPSKFVEFVPLSHRQGNCIPYAAIRWHDFGNRPALGRPLGHFSRHPDTPLLSLSPRRRFPRPTPERVFVADHQSSSGFSGTGPSAPPPQPIGT